MLGIWAVEDDQSEKKQKLFSIDDSLAGTLRRAEAFLTSLHRERMAHATAPPDPVVNCASCWEDITSDNYVEYLPFPSASKEEPPPTWKMGKFCKDCVGYLLNSQWKAYTESLQKTTCKAEQRRLLKRGPPINLRDNEAMPCPDDGEVMMLWYMSDNQERSARLTGSLVGEEREKFWQEQMKFYIEDEPEEEEGKAK